MPKLTLLEFMSLDGVVQAPSYADEDQSQGFLHGGWNRLYIEKISMQWIVESLTQAAGFLFGRRTYEMFAAHWPNASDEEQVLAKPLNELPKYVVSRTLSAPLPWKNSELLGNDTVKEVAELKKRIGGNLVVVGSPQLAQFLLAHDLVDELRIMIDPVFVGGGKKFYPEQGQKKRWRLMKSDVTPAGAILATYAVATP
jgi:dihydrofolate reductase